MEQFSQDKNPTGEKPKEENNEMPDENSSVEKYDRDYQQKVVRFFNDETIKGYGNSPEGYSLNDDIESALRKLVDNENIKNLKPEDYSYALSYLIGQMNHDLYKGGADLEINKEHEIRAQQAKELFMESCKKIYSEVDETSPRGPMLILGNLKKMRATGFDDIKFEIDEVAEIVKKGKAESDINKLKDMAKKIQLLLPDIIDTNNNFARVFESEVEEGNTEYVKDYKKKKASINEYIYEFMLIRDNVYEKLYGDKNISVEDAKKMDETREKIEKE